LAFIIYIYIYIYLTAIGLLPGGSVYKGTYIQQGTAHTSHEITQHCTNSTMVIDKYKNRQYKYNEPKQYTDISKHRRKKTSSNTETAMASPPKSYMHSSSAFKLHALPLSSSLT
jgi:hypothetical protein